MTKATRRVAVRENDEGGAVAVEFALVVPVLLLIVFGIVNFGVIFSQQLSLNNAVRQGARSAVVVGNAGQVSCADVVSQVRGASQALAMDQTAIDVTVKTQSADGLHDRTSRCGADENPNTSDVVCEDSYQETNSSTTTASTTDSILVTATYQSGYLALFPGPAPLLQSKAVYRCEFT